MHQVHSCRRYAEDFELPRQAATEVQIFARKMLCQPPLHSNSYTQREIPEYFWTKTIHLNGRSFQEPLLFFISSRHYASTKSKARQYLTFHQSPRSCASASALSDLETHGGDLRRNLHKLKCSPANTMMCKPVVLSLNLLLK